MAQKNRDRGQLRRYRIKAGYGKHWLDTGGGAVKAIQPGEVLELYDDQARNIQDKLEPLDGNRLPPPTLPPGRDTSAAVEAATEEAADRAGDDEGEDAGASAAV